MGVIAVETRGVERFVPADPSNPESREMKETMGGKAGDGHVLDFGELIEVKLVGGTIYLSIYLLYYMGRFGKYHNP